MPTTAIWSTGSRQDTELSERATWLADYWNSLNGLSQYNFWRELRTEMLAASDETQSQPSWADLICTPDSYGKLVIMVDNQQLDPAVQAQLVLDYIRDSRVIARHYRASQAARQRSQLAGAAR